MLLMKLKHIYQVLVFRRVTNKIRIENNPIKEGGTDKQKALKVYDTHLMILTKYSLHQQML